MKNNDNVGVEHLLASAILASGGSLTVRSDSLTDHSLDGKYIALTLNDDSSITMTLEEFDGNSK